MPVVDLEFRRAHPSRQKGYRPTYTDRPLMAPSDVSVVPSHLLATEIEPRLARLDAEIDAGENRGALVRICQWAADSLTTPEKPVSVDAVVRRLYDVRTGRTRTVRASMADAIMLAFGVDIERDTDLPTVPAGKKAARERIDIKCEMLELKLTRRQRNEMAEDLLEWSRLVIHDGYEALLAEDVEEQVAA